jgi:DNA-binding protein H-NS
MVVKKKKELEEEIEEEIEEETEEMPAWAKSLQSNLETLLKSKPASTTETEQIIPAPKAPARKEDDPQEPQKTEPKKNSFWDWLI